MNVDEFIKAVSETIMIEYIDQKLVDKEMVYINFLDLVKK